MQNNVAAKLWARKLYEEAQKESVWSGLSLYSGPTTFTKNSIKHWWDHRKYANKPRVLVNPREEAKNELSAWFSVELDTQLRKELTKEGLLNVGTTSNTKQTSNDRPRSS